MIMVNDTIKVLCVDDNFLVAEGIRIKLALAGGFDWLGHLSDADHLLEQVQSLRPDVVLLDIDMPGKNAFEALEELSQTHPEARVIIVSGHVRADLIDRALDAGAWGYISKGDEADTIVSAIQKVMEGQCVLGTDAKAAYRAI
jgi:DNA-binding NarL/FixJ family response regulator